MFSRRQSSNKLGCLASQTIKKLEATNIAFVGQGRLLCPCTQIARPATDLVTVFKQILKGSLLWPDQLEKAQPRSSSSYRQLYRCRMWWAEGIFVQRERCHLLEVGKYSAHQDSCLGMKHRLCSPLSHTPQGGAHIQSYTHLQIHITSERQPMATRIWRTVRRHKNMSGVSVGSKQSTASFYGTSRHESHIIINVDNPTETLRESEFCSV